MSSLSCSCSGVRAHLVRSMRGGTTDEKAVEFFATTLEAKLKGYEAILSKQKYLAGDVRSLPGSTSHDVDGLPPYRKSPSPTSSTCPTAPLP